MPTESDTAPTNTFEFITTPTFLYQTILFIKLSDQLIHVKSHEYIKFPSLLSLMLLAEVKINLKLKKKE